MVTTKLACSNTSPKIYNHAAKLAGKVAEHKYFSAMSLNIKVIIKYSNKYT